MVDAESSDPQEHFSLQSLRAQMCRAQIPEESVEKTIHSLNQLPLHEMRNETRKLIAGMVGRSRENEAREGREVPEGCPPVGTVLDIPNWGQARVVEYRPATRGRDAMALLESLTEKNKTKNPETGEYALKRKEFGLFKIRNIWSNTTS